MAIQTPLQVPLLKYSHKNLQHASMQRPHPNVSLTMLENNLDQKEHANISMSPLKTQTLTQSNRLGKVQLKYRAAFDCHICHTLTLPIYKNCKTLNFSHSTFNPVNASG
jgi:hypothetical protein